MAAHRTVTVVLSVYTDSDDAQEDPARFVATMLDGLRSDLLDASGSGLTSLRRVVRDANGNTVGDFGFHTVTHKD